MVKYLVMDVDGTLTDGKIYMGNEGEIVKAFSIKDGYAVNYILKSAGIEPLVITGRSSRIVENRCREIGIDRFYQGRVEKLSALKDAVGENNFGQCAYFGDDVLDLVCMKPVRTAGGVVGCPSDAVREVKAVADYVCINRAGEGALREFSEWLVGGRLDPGEINKRVDVAVNYIQKLDKSSLKAGKVVVNDSFYYTVQEYDTKPVDECRLESHRKYIDIQWIVGGEEMIAVSDTASLVSEMEYNEESDITFWKPRIDMMKVVLNKGAYIVFYPHHAHMGCINTNAKHHVKKIVGKVKLFGICS